MSFCLPPEEVIETNRRITGHLHWVTGPAELESALARPNHSWGGVLFYPTLIQRAGVLLDGLVRAHAFHTGNKRTAWVSTTAYIEAFGVVVRDLPNEEVVEFMDDVAKHVVDEAGAAAWLNQRLA